MRHRPGDEVRRAAAPVPHAHRHRTRRRRRHRAAIRVAERGFEVDPTFVEQTRPNVERFRDFPSSSALFLGPDGQPRPFGSTLKNPGLARTYRLVSQGGVPVFYRGEIAQAIVSTFTRPPA